MACHRCGTCWDRDDTAPDCRTVRDIEMSKIKRILKMNDKITLCTNADCTMRDDCRRATEATEGRALGHFTPHNYSMGPRASNADRCAFYIEVTK
jgi:hypothetical protein